MDGVLFVFDKYVNFFDKYISIPVCGRIKELKGNGFILFNYFDRNTSNDNMVNASFHNIYC